MEISTCVNYYSKLYGKTTRVWMLEKKKLEATTSETVNLLIYLTIPFYIRKCYHFFLLRKC